MPELPEVETVKETLKPLVIGKQITDIIINYDKILDGINPDDFKAKLIGEVFRDIHRLGKYLIFILDHYSLVVHLRMEGKFYYKEPELEIDKHEHIIFVLDGKVHLRYHDTRKFGKMIVVDSTDLEVVKKHKRLAKLGLDGVSEITPAYLKEMFSKRQRSLKALLLDQEIIAGLGNIYVNEVCFLAGLHPSEVPSNLTDDDYENLARYIKDVLTRAILAGGTTIRSYTSSLGVNGRFQQELYVHSRGGEPCLVCEQPIEKIRVSGRGTYICNHCQKLRIAKDEH